MRQLLTLIFILGASVSHACKDAALNESFPIKNVEPFDTIVLATITDVTKDTNSQYGGFLSFTATIKETIKGSITQGAIISGKPTIEQAKAVCPAHLNIGLTYLLLLNKKDNIYNLSRFSFPTDNTHVYYSRYVQEVKTSVNRR